MIINSIWQKITITTHRIRLSALLVSITFCLSIYILYLLNLKIIESYFFISSAMPAFFFAIAGFIFGFRGNILDGVSKKAHLSCGALSNFNKFMQEIIITSSALAILSLILLPLIPNHLIFFMLIFACLYIICVVFLVSVYAYYVYDEAYN
ncbi:hypothetical protein L3V83_13850 [Thiotrichales bacterium 19X7-9]|nr:hypothetical protein [Thiotrichales bacterium 19X7-9]